MPLSTLISTERAGQSLATPFRFLDPGRLVDAELELVSPDPRWFDGFLASCHHPLTKLKDPEWYNTDRDDLNRLAANAPGGREPADPARGRVPVYHFWMRLNPLTKPPIPFAGVLSFRAATTSDIQLYYGHFGYTVFPPARGRHYAERACRLLFPLARRLGVHPIWITTGPDNLPSRKTCERLGAAMVETVDVPPGHSLYARGQRQKCRYRIIL